MKDMFGVYESELPFGWGPEYEEEDDVFEEVDDDMGVLQWVVPCEYCRYRYTEECRWGHGDEEPDDDDFCSYGRM